MWCWGCSRNQAERPQEKNPTKSLVCSTGSLVKLYRVSLWAQRPRQNWSSAVGRGALRLSGLGRMCKMHVHSTRPLLRTSTSQPWLWQEKSDLFVTLGNFQQRPLNTRLFSTPVRTQVLSYLSSPTGQIFVLPPGQTPLSVSPSSGLLLSAQAVLPPWEPISPTLPKPLSQWHCLVSPTAAVAASSLCATSILDHGAWPSVSARGPPSWGVGAAISHQGLWSEGPGAGPATCTRQCVSKWNLIKHKGKEERLDLVLWPRFYFYFPGVVNGLCWCEYAEPDASYFPMHFPRRECMKYQ